MKALSALLVLFAIWTQSFAQEEPAWDWFGYDWTAEYGGNLFDENGETVGKVWWIDYNDIVAISLVTLPDMNPHYKRMKGFGLGYEWAGNLYRDDTPTNPIPMRWTFIPNGVTAYIDLRYTGASGQNWTVWGYLIRRW